MFDFDNFEDFDKGKIKNISLLIVLFFFVMILIFYIFPILFLIVVILGITITSYLIYRNYKNE
jgi:hypothetical protein